MHVSTTSLFVFALWAAHLVHGQSAFTSNVLRAVPCPPTMRQNFDSVQATCECFYARLSQTALAGIAVGAIVVLSCLVYIFITLFWRMRRRRLQRIAQEILDLEANYKVSPFPLPVEVGPLGTENAPTRKNADARSIRANTIKRQRLEKQLLAATECMVKLEDRQRRSLRRAAGVADEDEPVITRIRRMMSVGSGSIRRPPDIKQLRATTEQINALVMRIRALETNADWAEPLPEYH
ncbi:hypothetical protein K438DRAFT_1850293 [Mycena galopus ATCC 62051]|nr:hypothetical protein K438DRAFT_1850293 [Mycena galopus ATCC 62051]